MTTTEASVETLRGVTGHDQDQPGEFTVVSLNLRGVHDRWWKREPLVVAGLAELSPGIICLQEAATWCLQARWLAWRPSRRTRKRYHVVQARKRGFRGIFEGLAILSVYPASNPRRLALGHQGRIAQRAIVTVDGQPVMVANAHLDHRSEGAENRVAQARRLSRWLESDGPAVLCGDLNDRPESPALGVLTGRFRSAHIESGFEVSGTAPAWESGRVIDYILVSGPVTVGASGTCLDAPVDGTWPSDHIGLWARLSLAET